MKIYDSLTRQKKELKKPAKGPIKLFVCGPTVYDRIHIGNARTYLFFDTLVHYLRSQNYKIYYLQNITDIDDKIIQQAREEKLLPSALAKKYALAYRQTIKRLGINEVSKYAPATKYIKEIIKQVQALIDKGYAYKLDDGYYFDIAKFKDYGKLAKRTVAQSEDSVSRIDENIAKHNRGDFNLWKFKKDDEPSWPASFGAGRPGWHIEDTAITEYYFGPQYDWHGGGVDIKFPHHEAEIAQQESASGKTPLVKIWSHVGTLLVNGQKMSKSLGNFITINDFLEKYRPEILRYVILTHHYRSPLDYNNQLVIDTEKSLAGIVEFLAKLKLANKTSGPKVDIENYNDKFLAALENDFNTPEAIATIFALINGVNPLIWDLDKKTARNIAQWLKSRLADLKISLKEPKIPFKIRHLAKKRELLRSNKQFVQADLLRKQIEGLGYTLEDTPRGPLIVAKFK
ncbi:MAG: cysteine--tRNA ligase [bacterium]|nr:cysteine--tRNA ligase [bacterium]